MLVYMKKEKKKIMYVRYHLSYFRDIIKLLVTSIFPNRKIEQTNNITPRKYNKQGCKFSENCLISDFLASLSTHEICMYDSLLSIKVLLLLL